MAKTSVVKKDNKKLFRMTSDVAKRFETLCNQIKGDMTYDEIFEAMLKCFEEKHLFIKHPDRSAEIQSFTSCLNRLQSKYNESLDLYDNVKRDTEAKFEATLEAKVRNIAALAEENASLKENLKKLESELENSKKENFALNEKIAKLESIVIAKDDVINLNAANVEVAKKLAEIVECMKTSATGVMNNNTDNNSTISETDSEAGK